MSPLAHCGPDESRRVLIGHGGGGKKEEYRNEKAGGRSGLKKGRLKTGFGGGEKSPPFFRGFSNFGEVKFQFQRDARDSSCWRREERRH